jgi:hypothetical protein
MEKHGERGSAKILARNDYEVKWWWKYGQPAIDFIRATIEVKGELLGATLTRFMVLNGSDMQVTAECFPYGIPKPDIFRLQIDMRKAL